MNVPINFTKGVTLKWTESLADYPASAWTLKIAFVNPSSQVVVEATADGDDFSIVVPTAVSDDFQAGRYDWQAFVEDATERYCVGSGTTNVIEDFLNASSGHDGRSNLRKIVEAIDAYLLGDATKQQQIMRFGDREIRSYDRTDLMVLRDKLKRELAIEEEELRISQGKPHRNKIRTVFQ